ncbi:hypothetical protein [Aequorivita echinoideorum]|uniref:Lipoprotein n=1 Tax=Aequorivita echinoideorum TaxID=1549647 RepID=A0ABS5S2H0_9FLAO|nr:hypothetical protein [Aequorivita echinoideorum]MBT0607374.1 hypothetical protein [Aequorivita echinoideorum]
MRTFRILTTFLFATLLLACNNKNTDFEDKLAKLQKENDSIANVQNQIKQEHTAMMKQHEEFMEEISSGNLSDSTLVRDMAQHEVMLKKQDAVIKANDELMQGHNQLKQDFATLPEAEKEAQLKEMMDDHDRIMKDQDMLQKEIEQMKDEHSKMRENLSTQNKNEATTTS